MGSSAAIGLAVAACALLAGCGGDTGVTIINQTTTTVGSSAPPTTTAATPAAPAQQAPSGTAPSAPAGGGGANQNSKRYSGPCGQPGVIVGGSPATSDAAAIPGYTELVTDGVGCDFAMQVAAGWVSAWDPQCAPGCTRKISDLRCSYAGSGSHVQCFGDGTTIRFLLAFPTT